MPNLVETINLAGKRILTPEGKRYLRWVWGNKRVSKAQIARNMDVDVRALDRLAGTIDLPTRNAMFEAQQIQKAKLPPGMIEPWPEDMPQFEDHPALVRQAKRKASKKAVIF